MRVSLSMLLLAGSAILLLVISSILFYSFQEVRNLSDQLNQAIDAMQTTSSLSTRISGLILRQYNLVHSCYEQGDSAVKGEFVEVSNEVSEKYFMLEKTCLGLVELGKITDLKHAQEDFEAAAMRAFAMCEAGADGVASVIREVDDKTDSLGRKLSILNEINIIRSTEITKGLEGALLNHLIALVILTTLTMLTALLFLLLIRLTVIAPTMELIKGTKKVVEGELDIHIAPSLTQELGSLAQSFNAMVMHLRRNREEILEKKTALEELNREITALNKSLELKVRERTAELESFVYTVSHDLKSPLFSISGLLRMLGHPDFDREKNGELLERILTNLRSMENMINDLLELSRVGMKRARFEEVDLGLIVHTLILDEKVRSGVSDAEIIVGDLPRLVADEQQVSRLFQNIVSNAYKYRHPDRQLKVTISWREESQAYQFSVRDNGVGIDGDVVERIFGVFFRSAPQGIEGTGVGLAIAKKVVDNHGGKIWVESEPGRGSTFHFTISKRLGGDGPGSESERT